MLCLLKAAQESGRIGIVLPKTDVTGFFLVMEGNTLEEGLYVKAVTVPQQEDCPNG